MSERKPLEAVAPVKPAPLRPIAESVATEARTRAAREAREPDPAPLPIEPSPAHRPYRVQLDPETSRLFTEVLDPRTGGVLLRIPPGYKASTDEEATPPVPTAPVVGRQEGTA